MIFENMLPSLWEEESLDACRWGRNSPSGIIKPEWHSIEEHAPTSDSFLCLICISASFFKSRNIAKHDRANHAKGTLKLRLLQQWHIGRRSRNLSELVFGLGRKVKRNRYIVRHFISRRPFAAAYAKCRALYPRCARYFRGLPVNLKIEIER
jgi:hypothetical protein